MIVLNSGASGAKITVENSTIQVNVAEGEHNEQGIASLRNETGVIEFANCAVEASGSYKQTTEEGGETVALTPENVSVTLDAGTLIVDGAAFSPSAEFGGKVSMSEVRSKLVAKVGEKSYTSLQDAINDAPNGGKVEVLRDTAGAYLAVAKTVTVDIPAGVTVTGATYGLRVANNANARMIITGSGTVKGGTYGVMSAAGKMTLSGVSVEGGTYGALTQSGVFEMTAGAVSGGTYGVAATGGSVNISGGEATGVKYGLFIQGAVTAQITGGTFQGGINAIRATWKSSTKAAPTVTITGARAVCTADPAASGYGETSAIDVVNFFKQSKS